MKLLIVGLLLLNAGCGSPESIFAANQNRQVGKIYYSGPNNIPISRSQNGKGGQILIFKEGKCRYRLFLDKNQVVTGWDYLSDPKCCKIEIGWGAPW